MTQCHTAKNMIEKTVNHLKFALRYLFVCALCLAMCFAAGTLTQIKADAHTNQAPAGKPDAEYLFGTKFEVPESDICHDGSILKSEALVHYPSGRTYRSGSILLDETGEYTIEYRAYDKGKEYRKYKKFMVYRELYNVIDGITAKAEYKPSHIKPDVNGLNVILDSKSRFIYNRIINLAGLDAKTPFLKGFFSPAVKGELDAYTLVARLTDVHDPENYITYKLQSTRAGINHGVTYILCGANGQTLTGYEAGWNRMHRNDIYGFPIDCSFYGVPKNNGDNTFSLYFDCETFEACASANYGVICDLDSPYYFPSDSFLGFSTGEVYLSMWAEDYIKSNVGVELISIAGHDLTLPHAVDSIPPDIFIDFEGYDGFLTGKVNCDYKIFGAAALDDYSGRCKVSVKVYQNYYDEEKFDCCVRNGVFKPRRAGRYTVEYSAADTSGNIGKKVFDIQINDSAPALTVVPCGERTDSGFVGTNIELCEVRVEGGVGKNSYSVNVTDEKGNKCAVLNNCFKPLAAGNYKVEYIARDFIGQEAAFEYTVKVKVSEAPVFGENPDLPDIIFNGIGYVLPDLKATQYNGSAVSVDTFIDVKDGHGVRRLGKDRKTVFYISEDQGEVTVTYVAVNDENAKVSYNIPCVRAFDEDGRLSLTNYFITDGIKETHANESFTAFVADSEKSQANIKFANLLLDDNLKFGFTVDENRHAFNKISIRLKDNLGVSVTACIEEENGVLILKTGEKSFSLDRSFNAVPKNSFDFIFDQRNSKLTVDGINYIPVICDDAGNGFNGFNGHKAELSVTLHNITGDSALNVVSVNSQTINDNIVDLVAPRIYIDGVYGGSGAIGDTVVLNDVYVGDVIDPHPEISLKVTAPDGRIVNDLNGNPIMNVIPEKGISFVIDQYGAYSVSYKAKDNSGLTKNLSYKISVTDDIAPAITADAGMISECRLSDMVVIPDVSLSDNYTSPENIILLKYVILPNGRITELPGDCNSFRASYGGEYKICYVAYDDAGNQSMYTLSLICK